MKIILLLLCALTCFGHINNQNLSDDNIPYGVKYERDKSICDSKILNEVRLDNAIRKPIEAYYNMLHNQWYVDMGKLSPLLIFSEEGGQNYVTLYLESLIRYENGVKVDCFTMINGLPTFIGGDYKKYVDPYIWPKFLRLREYTRDGGFLFDPQWIKYQIKNNELLKISQGGALALTPILGEYEVISQDIESILQKVLPMCSNNRKINLNVYEEDGKVEVQIIIATRLKNEQMGYVNYHGNTVLINANNISKYFRPVVKDGKQPTKEFPEIMDSKIGFYDPVVFEFTINEDHSISQKRIN